VTDPLDVLRVPDEPAQPDPAFAARLRARLERALDLPKGVAVSTTTAIRPTAALTVEPVTGGAAIPYLAVRDARAAIDWYVEILGAVLQGDPIVMDDNRIGHAELALGGGLLYLADEFPDIGVVAPQPDAAAVSLVLHVADVDARLAAARANGATVVREVAESYGSRNATIVDPQGHRWMLQQPMTTVPASEQLSGDWHQGDLGYLSIWVPDVDRAAAFYAAVLGWQYLSDQAGESRLVVGQALPVGIWPSADPRHYCAYAVGDVDAAIRRVRAAGGTAQPPTQQPWGRAAECTDAAGQPFSVFQPKPEPGPRPPINGNGHGDLSYLTYQVPSSQTSRAFFTSVFGWSYTPGRIDDGWQIDDAVPMSGLSGGHDAYTVVPMWRVDDIAAAVERVRAAGGTATDVESQPYGLSSTCTDDQGLPFYLGQH
jgi:uncharacterized glyoxalase superfamily protein PhnB